METVEIYNRSGNKSSNLLARNVPVLPDITSFPLNVIKDKKHRVATIKDAGIITDRRSVCLQFKHQM